jgi:hypothetical protein
MAEKIHPNVPVAFERLAGAFISMRLELDFFQAGLQRLQALESGDLGEQFDAELRVERLRELRLKMRGEGTLKREQHTMKGARV